MRKSYIFLLLTLVGFCCTNCTPVQKIPLTTDLLLIKMERGPSRGRYPIYEMTIYQNKIAEYKGKRYTPKLGTWVRKLSDSEWNQLQQQIKQADLWRQKEFFRSESLDLPLVTITQFEKGVSKSVSGKDTRPPGVILLERSLENIALKEGWIEKAAFDFGLPKNVMPNQLRIELRPGVYVHNWVYKYGLQNMQILAELPEKSNYWLVGFDPTVTFPQEMEQLLSYDEQVVQYAFNKIEK